MSIKLLLVKEGDRIKWSNNATGKGGRRWKKKETMPQPACYWTGYALLFKSKTAVLEVSNLMAKQSTRLYKNKQTWAFPEPHKEKAL